MRKRKRINRGAAMMEFMLLVPVWLPLILGTMWIGSAMVRGQQITQVARDLGSMYSRGVDFSSTGGSTSSAILTEITQQVGTVAASGTGVVIFTSLTYVGNSVCASLNGTNGSTVYGVDVYKRQRRARSRIEFLNNPQTSARRQFDPCADCAAASSRAGIPRS